MSVENSFLRKLIETKEWETVLNKDITADYFSGANKRAFKWLSDFKVKYGELPDKETFKKHFPEVNLNIESPETVGYYCDELRRKIRHNKLVTTLEKIDNLINDRDVDKCYTLLESLISEVNNDFTFTEKVDLGADTEKRFQDYLVNKATGGMTGIPLGIYPLDKQTGGIKEVDLISFLAKSGVGKTFLLCIIASNLIKAGYKTLFLTKEMSPHQILKRVDAIMSGVSYSRLKDGALTNDEESIYKDYLENIAPKYASKLSIELIINGVAECAAKIDAYKPDIVLIDGGYLMSEGKDPEDWKAVLAVFKAFKIIALNRKIPIITTTQLTDKGNIAYATSLKQYCDGMWAMLQDEVQRAAKEVEIQTLKIRDGEWTPKFTMQFDFREMNYDVVYANFDDKKERTFKVDKPQTLKKLS